MGSVFESFGRLRIQATLYDAFSGEEVVARASVEGASEELFSLVDRLTARLLAAQQPDSDDYFVRAAPDITNLTTVSPVS